MTTLGGGTGMKIERPREGQKSTIKYCARWGVPNPPCEACSDPCDGEHLKTETQIFRDGQWERVSFTPSYEHEERMNELNKKQDEFMKKSGFVWDGNYWVKDRSCDKQ